MSGKWPKELIVLLLFVLFVYAAVSKLMNYNLFIFQLSDQPFIDQYATFLGFAIPACLLLVSSLLISKRTLKYGLIGALGLMIIFTVYIVLIQLNFFNRIPCSCAGIFKTMTWHQHLYFNIFFTVIAALAVYLHNRPSTEKPEGNNTNVLAK